MKQKKKKIKIKIKGLKGTYHFWLRSEQRNITLENIQKAVKYGVITDAGEDKKRLIYDNIDIILIPETRKMITVISKGPPSKKNTILSKEDSKKLKAKIKIRAHTKNDIPKNEAPYKSKQESSNFNTSDIGAKENDSELTYEEYMNLGKKKK